MDSKIKNYVRYYGWEALLALILSTAALMTFAQGFYIPDGIADSFPAALLFSAVVLIYCFAGNFNRRTMIIFSAVYVVIAGLLLLTLRARGTDIVDQENSDTAVYIYYIAGLVIPTVVFLLSRFRIGIIVLFLAGIYMYALMDFLHFEARSWCLLLYILGAIVLFLLRQYRIMTLKNSTVDPEFGKFSGTTTATSLASLLMAFVLFLGVVRPLDLPTADFKLITKLMNYEVLEMLGIAQQYPMPDVQSESDQFNDEELNTDQLDEQNNTPEETQAMEGEGLTMADAGASNPEDADAAAGVNYEKHWWKMVLAILIALLLILASLPFLWKRYRKRKMERLRSGTGREQVIALYGWYMKKFSRIGFRRPPNYTEREYADLYEESLEPYFQGTMGLRPMTDLFLRARYGEEDIQPEECEAFSGIYPAFLENYRRLHGRFKYALRFFML